MNTLHNRYLQLFLILVLNLVLSNITLAGDEKFFLGEDREYCKGQCFRLVVDNPFDPENHDYKWYFNEVYQPQLDSMNNINVCPVGNSFTAKVVQQTDSSSEGEIQGEITYTLAEVDTIPETHYSTCLDSCVILKGPTGGQIYTWESEFIEDKTFKNPEFCGSTAGDQIVIVTSYRGDSLDCAQKDTVIVSVIDSCSGTNTSINLIDTYNNQQTYFYINSKGNLACYEINKFANNLIEIYSINGQQVYSGKLDQHAELNITWPSSGIYLLAIPSAEYIQQVFINE